MPSERDFILKKGYIKKLGLGRPLHTHFGDSPDGHKIDTMMGTLLYKKGSKKRFLNHI